MRVCRPPLRVLFLALALSAACGCSLLSRSPESRYYVMTLPAERSLTSGARDITGPHVGIGPVTIPGYLDRKQIFVRLDDATDVSLEEYDRWGENLGDGVTRLLVEGTTARLAATGGMALPLRSGNEYDWRLGVDVVRLDGAPGRDVVLDAGWSLSRANGEVIREGRYGARTQAGAGMDGLVRAHGQLLDGLAEVLAQVVLQAHNTQERR